MSKTLVCSKVLVVWLFFCQTCFGIVAVVSQNNTKTYVEPNSSSLDVHELKRGDIVNIITGENRGSRNNFIKVKYSNETVWINKRRISTNKNVIAQITREARDARSRQESHNRLERMSVEDLYREAWGFKGSKDFQKALELCSYISNRDKQSLKWKRYTAYCYWDMNNFGKAKEILWEVIRSNRSTRKDRAIARINIGHLLTDHWNEHQKALDVVKQADINDLDDASLCYDALIKIHLKLGNRNCAKHYGGMNHVLRHCQSTSYSKCLAGFKSELKRAKRAGAFTGWTASSKKEQKYWVEEKRRLKDIIWKIEMSEEACSD